MRTLLSFVALFLAIASNAQNYEIIQEIDKPVTEYRNGKQVTIVSKDSITVAVALSKAKNDYGSYYQAGVVITNGSGKTFTFAPEDVIVKLLNKRDTTVALTVYTSDKYVKKVRREQTWIRFFNEMFDAIVSDGDNGGAAQSEITKTLHRRELHNETNGYLTKNTMRQGDVLSGFLNINYAKGKILMMRIPVNGINFDFKWNVKK